MAKKSDVIVIGAGIGGLAVAAALASRGKNVTVLEKAPIVGGRATSFPLKGILTEYGFHGLSAGGHAVKLLDLVGQSIPLQTLDPNFVLFRNKKFHEVPGEIDDFATWDYIPAGDRPELIDTLHLVEKMSFDEMEEWDYIGFGDWLKDHTSSLDVQDFIAQMGNIYITEEFNSNLSAGEVLRCLKLALKEKAWSVYPKDGPLNLINEAFAKAVTAGGGEVLLNTVAREITVRSEAVTGVIAESKDGVLKLEAPIVISNMPVWDIFRLIPRDFFPRWFVDKARFLEEHSQLAARASAGITCISKKPLMSYKTAVLVPCMEEVNSTGASYVRWLSEPTNWVPSIAPQGQHLFQYGPVWPRWYVDLLRERKSIYDKEIRSFWREIKTMFPDFKDEDIIWKGDGVILATDTSMAFPGNAWKQRLDVRAPNVAGLYNVGDTVRGWGVAMDTAVSSAVLCAQKILKTKLIDLEEF
ncbi:MAG: FAD-dependent oxidoreductase [Desulfobacterales bacterium]|jgi:phytoene dehydrogenase-like protein|nr:FAD-dependent oxidoreductase [Desulfobacterales bacterium]